MKILNFNPTVLYPIALVFNSSYPCPGVEHLLRDVKDTTISTLATEVLLFPFNLFLFIDSFHFCYLSLLMLFFFFSSFSHDTFVVLFSKSQRLSVDNVIFIP